MISHPEALAVFSRARDPAWAARTAHYYYRV